MSRGSMQYKGYIRKANIRYKRRKDSLYIPPLNYRHVYCINAFFAALDDAYILHISMKFSSLYEFLIRRQFIRTSLQYSVIFPRHSYKRLISRRGEFSGSYNERTILDLESCKIESSISPYIYILHVYHVY